MRSTLIARTFRARGLEVAVKDRQICRVEAEGLLWVGRLRVPGHHSKSAQVQQMELLRVVGLPHQRAIRLIQEVVEQRWLSQDMQGALHIGSLVGRPVGIAVTKERCDFVRQREPSQLLKTCIEVG